MSNTTNKLSPDLKRAGFTEPDFTVNQRLIASISGLEKQGKTHFSLTAAGRTAYISLDVGHEGVIHKFKNSVTAFKDIKTPQNVEEAEKVWNEYKASYRAALSSPSVDVVTVDTKTEAWEVIRLAKLEKLSKVMPHYYEPVNFEFAKLIREAFDYKDKSVIFIHKRKPKYVNDKKTDDYEFAGFSKVPFLVQVSVVVYRYPMDDDDYPGEFAVCIEECRHNPDLVGFELVGSDCNFETLKEIVLE